MTFTDFMTAVGGLILIGFIVWMFRRNWNDLLDVLFGPEEQEPCKTEGDHHE